MPALRDAIPGWPVGRSADVVTGPISHLAHVARPAFIGFHVHAVAFACFMALAVFANVALSVFAWDALIDWRAHLAFRFCGGRGDKLARRSDAFARRNPWSTLLGPDSWRRSRLRVAAGFPLTSGSSSHLVEPGVHPGGWWWSYLGLPILLPCRGARLIWSDAWRRSGWRTGGSGTC